MKKMLFTSLILYLFCLNLFSQDEMLGKDSLPVYTVIDKDIAAIIDSFIMETRPIAYPIIDFFIYIDIFDDNTLNVVLDSRKGKRISDSIILYKHPNCFQVFVSHGNHLIETIICKRPYFDCKDCYPTKILKNLGIKQGVYYQEIPVDFYRDNLVKGEIPYEDLLTGWMYDYYEGKWHEAIKIYHTDNY